MTRYYETLRPIGESIKTGVPYFSPPPFIDIVFSYSVSHSPTRTRTNVCIHNRYTPRLPLYFFDHLLTRTPFLSCYPITLFLLKSSVSEFTLGVQTVNHRHTEIRPVNCRDTEPKGQRYLFWYYVYNFQTSNISSKYLVRHTSSRSQYRC